MNAFRWLLQALHESRRRSAEREIGRYAQLIVQAQEHDRRVEIQAVGREEKSSWHGASTSAAEARG